MTETLTDELCPEPPQPPAGLDYWSYWYALIDETVFAPFVDLSPRTLQNYRSRGGGPKFVRISSRCVKYRRIDGKAWSDERLRASTSDQGAAA